MPWIVEDPQIQNTKTDEITFNELLSCDQFFSGINVRSISQSKKFGSNKGV